MISKKELELTLIEANLILCHKNYNKIDRTIIALVHAYIINDIDKKEFLEESEKTRFKLFLEDFKSNKGTAEEFYNQHKKLLNEDENKKRIFLISYQLNSIKDLKKKEEYPSIFYDEDLRSKILEEQNSRCLLCDCDISSTWPHLHHVDYNKQNCSRGNLVFLCNRCHSKTNFNRKYWQNYITEKHIY